jgi:serine/threonine-protein phosphatase 2B catalytic subunit
MTLEQLYSVSGHRAAKPDWQLLRQHLGREGSIDKACFMQLISQAKTLLRREPTLLDINDPLVIVGDIHGQFSDMLHMLEQSGPPAEIKYLFLGDYVDRGSFSVEVVTLLFAMKLNFPDRILLLRGNHESRQMSSFFNFREEVLYKFDSEVYDALMEAFDCLPLSAVVNKKFIALHGGISPQLKTLKDFASFDRFREPPKSGIFCDILWADPVPDDEAVSSEPFTHNSTRGCSYLYGSSAVTSFLKRNKLISVIRAHEVQLDGYKMHRWGGATGFPSVITIFSAPNYCDVYNNKGAVIKLVNSSLNVVQFNYTQHPYILPDFMDVFSWSLPFVLEKVVEITQSLAQPITDEVLESSLNVDALKLSAKQSTAAKIKSKLKFMSQMMRAYKTLREDHELIVQLKGLCPGNRIPHGLLMEGRPALLSGKT